MVTVSQKAQTVIYDRQEKPVMPPKERIQHFGPVYHAADIVKLFQQQARRCCQCSELGCGSHDVANPARGGCPLDNPIPDFLDSVSQPAVVDRARLVVQRHLGSTFDKTLIGGWEWVSGAFGSIVPSGVLKKGKTYIDRYLSKNLDKIITSQKLDDIIRDIAKDGAAREHLHEAFRVDLTTNSFPEVLGDHLCPKDVLCEGGGKKLIEGRRVIVKSCNAGLNGGKPQIIGGVEGMIGRIGRVLGWMQEDLIRPQKKIDKTISIIGAGLAGMEAAIRLSNHGFKVRLIYKEDKIGGVARHNIVGFKLAPDVLPAYAECFRRAGIEMVANTTVDKAMLHQIQQESYKTILATGAQTPNTLEVGGVDTKGVVQAMPYLNAVIRRENWGEKDVEGTEPGGIYNGAGKRVIVIGGGDTSIDVVRCLVRQGAEDVILVYRGEEVPASAKEKAMAIDEGVAVQTLQNPVRIEGAGIDETFVHAVHFSRPSQGNEPVAYKANMVVQSIGFNSRSEVQTLGLAERSLNPGNSAIRVIDLNTRLQPDLRMIGADGEPDNATYAGGDAVRGSSLAVWAVRDGREIARQIIDEYDNVGKLGYLRTKARHASSLPFPILQS